MSVVLQPDPRAKITYAYHNELRPNNDQGRSTTSRTLIGKIDPETGKIVRTSGTRRKKQIDEALITSEIEDFNRKIDEKRKLELQKLHDNSEEFDKLHRQYELMQAKYTEFSKMMLSFAESIVSIFKE